MTPITVLCPRSRYAMRTIFFSLAERFAGACALFSASELSKQSRAPTHCKFASRGDVDAYALRLLGKKIEGCETSKQKILGSFAHESWACGPRCDRKVALPRLLDGRSRSSSCPFRPGPPKHEGNGTTLRSTSVLVFGLGGYRDRDSALGFARVIPVRSPSVAPDLL